MTPAGSEAHLASVSDGFPIRTFGASPSTRFAAITLSGFLLLCTVSFVTLWASDLQDYVVSLLMVAFAIALPAWTWRSSVVLYGDHLTTTNVRRRTILYSDIQNVDVRNLRYSVPVVTLRSGDGVVLSTVLGNEADALVADLRRRIAPSNV